MSDNTTVPSPSPQANAPLSPSEVIFYGVKMGGDILVDSLLAVMVIPHFPKSKPVEGNPDYQIVAAYGYSYEGHCYRFDQVRVLVFTSKDCTEKAAQIGAGENACGFAPQYQRWRIPSDATVLDFSTQVGTCEKVVLDANRPGRRPPNTYRSEMLLAHRGGKFSE
jgi:hypothetical protein